VRGRAKLPPVQPERADPSGPSARALAPSLAALALLAVGLAGCGHQTRSVNPTGSRVPRQLIAEARPIGRGPRFHPPVQGTPLPPCLPSLGRRIALHVEVFGADEVVLLPAGIGVRRPRLLLGRVTGARCYGRLVTLDPTGVVMLAPGQKLTLAALFRSWGQPLGARRLAGFSPSPGGRVRVYLDGRPYAGAPGNLPLRRHAEIVLEAGPYVPPHAAYTFPPGS
jgi:hypothetical protein